MQIRGWGLETPSQNETQKCEKIRLNQLKRIKKHNVKRLFNRFT